MLGSTADTCTASVYSGSWVFHGVFSVKMDSDPEVRIVCGRWLPCRGAEADSHGPDFSADHLDFSSLPYIWWLTSLLCSCRGHRCCSVVVDVAVLPQRQVPAVGLDSWDEGKILRALYTGTGLPKLGAGLLWHIVRDMSYTSRLDHYHYHYHYHHHCNCNSSSNSNSSCKKQKNNQTTRQRDNCNQQQGNQQ